MQSYERSVQIDADLDTVWEFHSTASGLIELTPDWMHLVVEDVRGPDGESDPSVLEAGSHLQCSVRPFGVGPRQSWVSEITERDRHEYGAYFRDVMQEGPFDHWEHSHLFYPDNGQTFLVDRIRYELPLGPIGPAVAVLGFEPMFRFRHRKTRELLEEDTR